MTTIRGSKGTKSGHHVYKANGSGWYDQRGSPEVTVLPSGPGRQRTGTTGQRSKSLRITIAFTPDGW
jgi:hypothetical protein